MCPMHTGSMLGTETLDVDLLRNQLCDFSSINIR